MAEPRVHAILVVKDEVDVVENAVRVAAGFCDRVLALDNGSTDGTYELLLALREQVPQLEAVDRDPRPFFDGIRAKVFHEHRNGAGPDDWWLHLDADERMIGDPRPLLAEVPPAYNIVAGSHHQYYLVPTDADAYEADPAGWLARPVEDRIRWCRNDAWSPRFFRRIAHWKDTLLPDGPVRIYPEMVANRHYQLRDPAQIQRRYDTRRGKVGFEHVDREWDVFEKASPDDPLWRRYIARQDALVYDDGTTPLLTRNFEVMPLRPGWRRAVEDVIALGGGYGAAKRMAARVAARRR